MKNEMKVHLAVENISSLTIVENSRCKFRPRTAKRVIEWKKWLLRSRTFMVSISRSVIKS